MIFGAQVILRIVLRVEAVGRIVKGTSSGAYEEPQLETLREF